MSSDKALKGEHLRSVLKEEDQKPRVQVLLVQIFIRSVKRSTRSSKASWNSRRDSSTGSLRCASTRLSKRQKSSYLKLPTKSWNRSPASTDLWSNSSYSFVKKPGLWSITWGTTGTGWNTQSSWFVKLSRCMTADTVLIQTVLSACTTALLLPWKSTFLCRIYFCRRVT